ncbi:AlpA family transcriptional regulator [Acetobacter tropicalis]|uniref:helix-turn-helix transcriptional regulator n=1 Tax=Acetobacter TaxID=434 RepID=UPI0009DCF591|nr:AlpA family phage regulatory protein [Acetobacter tropicalis]ATI12990.1 AlpA family phage regulatory protein [Acetobacter pomorum]KAA8388633.1 AlpA family phage regulatory protein [Acetobacter tropicalis]KAA8391191.1 AlpA family phage regulatory protein [Acetobacter tropicalis]MBC9009279.1 AlpA family phage regulatory protein [Acetobacter tropicalis]MDO8170679.1 AlpA family phage regulatory protein [Acetobacter tropicalis]
MHTTLLDTLIRPSMMAQILSVNRSTLYRWVKRGDFPPPVHVGQNTSGWWSSTIQQWQREQMLTSQNEVAA